MKGGVTTTASSPTPSESSTPKAETTNTSKPVEPEIEDDTDDLLNELDNM
jgi:hypothetical protein